MKHIKKILALLIVFVMLVPVGIVSAENDGTFEKWYYSSVFETIKHNYPFEMDNEAIARAIAETVLEQHPELLEDVIAATVDQLDEHSTYMSPEASEEFDNFIGSEYVGIGVVVERGKGAVLVTGVITDSPAQRAGLLPGDRFIKVGDTDVTEYTVNQLSALVRGPEGSTVTLTMERNGYQFTVNVERAQVRQETVTHKMMAKGVGYMNISMFSTNTPNEIGVVDQIFKRNKVKKLIIDLRDNPGGELVSVVTSLGYFVPRGENVIEIYYGNEDRNRALRSVGDVTDRCYYNKVIVLVNENTASAAELFAGNIQHYGIGKVLGTTTYGKGTVQEFIPLVQNETHNLGTLKFTTAEYKLPGNIAVNGVGITPDYPVANRRVRLDTSDMEDMVYCSGYAEGNTGTGVLAIKQRLDALGYYVGDVDEVFDGELTRAVKQLQTALGLPATGIINMELQGTISNIVREARIEMDDQFDKAYELIKNGR